MEIKVTRLKSNSDATIGVIEVNCNTICGCVEDQVQFKEKVKHETRVSPGRYPVKLRAEGGFYNRYKDRYDIMKHGLLCVTNGPNWTLKCPDGREFQYILIHPGNSSDDTSGCLLPNYSVDFLTFKGGNSTSATLAIYEMVVPELLAGNEVWIEYVDQDLD